MTECKIAGLTVPQALIDALDMPIPVVGLIDLPPSEDSMQLEALVGALGRLETLSLHDAEVLSVAFPPPVIGSQATEGADVAVSSPPSPIRRRTGMASAPVTVASLASSESMDLRPIPRRPADGSTSGRLTSQPDNVVRPLALVHSGTQRQGSSSKTAWATAVESD